MLVKSRASGNHVDHLEETFTILCKYQMKLNPTKFASRITFRKFLRFMVSHRGIEANLEKIQMVRIMEAPKMVKKVQRLT